MRISRLLSLLFIFIAVSVQAQNSTEIFGRITDAASKDVLPYVNIRLIRSGKAGMTDMKGEYRIRTTEKIDSISFSYIGYRTRAVPVRHAQTQEINLEMNSDELKLTEITVKAGKKKKREIDTVANYVFYQVLRNKEKNRVNNLVSYKYENYDKFQISLLNPSKKFINFFLFRPFGFAFENKDTTETGSMYVPGLIRETLSDVYYRVEPRKQERIYTKAEKMTGVDNPTVSNIVNVEFQENDPYGSMYYFAKTFFNAPFSPIGLGIYYYYVTDTQKIDGRVSYKFNFVGKAKEDLALKGYAWIDSATWAIKYIQYRPNEKANLNFINEYDAKLEYTLVDGKYWMKSGEVMNSVGSLFKSKTKLGIYVQKLVEKKNYETNIIFPDSIFAGLEDKILLDSARKRSVAYWDSSRFTPLTPSQQRVFFISDTIKEVPAFKVYQWLGVFFTSAFADAGPISIGRVLNFASRNSVEGWRARFGFETNSRFKKPGTPINNFMRKFYFTAYGAYGFKDHDFKYMAHARINLPVINERWQQLGAMYRYDIRVPGQDENQTLVTFDNIFTIISGRTLSKVMKVTEFNVTYERDWIKDFSTILSFTEKTFYNIPGVSNFEHTHNHVLYPVSKFNVTEFMLDSRYSKNSLFTAGRFFRYFATTKYPVAMFRYIAGIGDIRGDNFNYHNFQITFKQRLYSPIGYTNYSIKAGKIVGRVPYTACYLTQGNLGILLDKFNYNLLREYEFISDQYAQLWIEHHFNGFIFNKIPGISKLKIREFLVFKSLIGSFNKKNGALLTVPTELRAPGPVPYIELGFGFENIAYLFRIDFLWRATYRNNGGQNWGVKIAIQPSF
ncbi:MAG: DUF5686 family protein [Chitinophagales bacterium]